MPLNSQGAFYNINMIIKFFSVNFYDDKLISNYNIPLDWMKPPIYK